MWGVETLEALASNYNCYYADATDIILTSLAEINPPAARQNV